MEQFVDLLKEINIAQIFFIFAGGWFLYNRLKAEIDKTNIRIDKLADKIEDIERRLCRIEGSLSIHGHCLFNQAKPDQKVQ